MKQCRRKQQAPVDLTTEGASSGTTVTSRSGNVVNVGEALYWEAGR